ncbi:zinc finger protein CONSTANS-LIKE 5-like [Benincasa hispida]|uniref:zinc finger protein CONSTANS-LIKE 5-like n=1 Tax=Benincasa hispida TaxID=102211 RepID=UPI001900E16F|nr:zinc finger protein CONSTANS-LIKE 5-like [Benincasa hispida]
MHTFSTVTGTITADASLCHLHSPDHAVSPPLFPSFPNFFSSHTSSSSLLPTYSQLSELDLVLESSGFLPSEVSYSGSSGPCSSYGSPTSQPALIHRSMSSHSLQKNRVSHGPGARSSSLFDADGPAVRRVYSSGDLQGRTERGCSSESSLIIERMTKACRYSPEEKRERIERYKTKRNQRNFNKKIKYECRKTLADSRRRIRGRFARNEETENSNSTSSPVETWSYYDNAMVEEDTQDDGSWITFLGSYSVN